MKRLSGIPVLFAILSALPMGAQNSNPQMSFSAQEMLAKPSLVLNYNDVTSSFLEPISGLSFGGPHPTAYSPIPNAQTYSGAFDGSTDIVTIPSTAILNPAAISVSGWVYVGSLPSSYNVMFTNAGADAQVMVKSNGKLAFYVSAVARVSYDGTGVGTLTAGNWYFLSLTYDSTNGLKGYVNGVLDGSAAANGALLAGTGAATIGEYVGASVRYWSGQISNVTVYNAALTSTQINTLYTGGSIATGLIGQWKLNEGTGTRATDLSASGLHAAWTGTAVGRSGYYGANNFTSGAIATRQPGFDLTQLGNTSAGFAYNAWNAAPNNTLGAIEWNVPWSLLLHIDRLNWNHTGTLVLASKGDASSNANSWWKLTLAMDSVYAGDSKLCFTRNSPGAAPTAGAGSGTNHGVCTTGSYDAMPNGLGYDVIVSDSGTGAAGVGGAAALNLFINGSYLPLTAFSNNSGIGFGYAVVNVSGGTGYAASTAFASAGGGTNCTVMGTMSATSGVPNASGISFTQNNGCTSAPSIVLTSPTGTGAAFTTGTSGTLMNAATLPLMVPGSVSAGVYSGIDQADSTQTSTYVDEFAIFPGVLSQTMVQGLFYQSKFYQAVLGAVPAVRRNMILDEDGCGDIQNAMAVGMAIRYHLLGYGNLLGIVSESGGTDAAMYRQMLDQAGLNQVPVSVSSGAAGVGGCAAGNITAYNASTAQTVGAYSAAASMYRKIFAARPTVPIYVELGGAFTGMSDFMKSAADGISPLTGMQLFNQNAANGAYMVAQGLGCAASAPPNTVPCASSVSGDNSMVDYLAGQEVVNNNGIEPIYWTGGTPANTGPGMLATRTGKDPVYLEAVTNGSDSRHCFDCMAAAELMSNYFVGGVQMGVSGGTGYAAQTAFTSSGGGANCSVAGWMLATGGVPSGTFNYTWGAAKDSYAGIGSQCLTAPAIVLTAPTGTGAVVTAYPTSVCGTLSISSATVGSTSSAVCGHHFFQPDAENVVGAAANASGNAFGWFTNSLLDPAPGGAPRKQ